MAIVQGEVGRVRMFEDFLGAEVPLALETHFENLGQFVITGEGIEVSDGGSMLVLDSGGLNGVGRFTCDDTTDKDSMAIRTAICLDVGLMGTLVMECRIKSETIALQQNWFGLVNISNADDCIEDEIVDTSSGGTTIDDLTATSMCGFLRTSEITANTEWHAIWQGGTATGPATTTAAELGVDYVAGDYQILRLEVDPNGTARWYIDGVLLKTLAGAASTTTDMAAILMVESQSTAAAAMDVDYILVRANRDWTV